MTHFQNCLSDPIIIVQRSLFFFRLQDRVEDVDAELQVSVTSAETKLGEAATAESEPAMGAEGHEEEEHGYQSQVEADTGEEGKHDSREHHPEPDAWTLYPYFSPEYYLWSALLNAYPPATWKRW